MYVFEGQVVEGNSILAPACMWTFELCQKEKKSLCKQKR